MKRKTNNITFAIFALVFLVFSGCSRETPIQRDWEQYGTTLLQLISPATFLPDYESSLQRYPERRTLRLPMSDIRIGFTHFMQVGKCDLQELIAWRNSGAGRLMAHSQIMLYEHQFFVKLTECLQQSDAWLMGQDKFTERMQEVYEIKQKELPIVFWNATFASREFHSLFFLTGKTLPPFEQPLRKQRVNDALLYLKSVGENLGQPSLSLESRSLEKRYYELQKQAYGGQLLRSMDILTFYLQNLNSAMQKRIENPQEQTVTQSQLLNLFEQFNSQLYPYAERVRTESSRLLGNVNQLMQSQQELIPETFSDYYHTFLDMQDPQGLWKRFHTELHRHQHLWQELIGATSDDLPA